MVMKKKLNDKIIFVDIEGTVCTNEDNISDLHVDKTACYNRAVPYMDRIHVINKLYDDGCYIVYWSGRGTVSKIDYKDFTVNQLQSWGAKFHDVQTGNKPHFDVYVCDKSWNSEEWFNGQLLGVK